MEISQARSSFRPSEWSGRAKRYSVFSFGLDKIEKRRDNKGYGFYSPLVSFSRRLMADYEQMTAEFRLDVFLNLKW